MVDVNYLKRRNNELFRLFESPDFLSMKSVQNYIPIYDCFFSLNETNYNSINLNQKWYITNLVNKESENTFSVKLKNSCNQKTKDKTIFFKMAPLLDPFKYLVGKYGKEEELFNLPKHNSSKNIHEKLKTSNNSAYIDGFFAYLNNYLFTKFNFVNGLEFYGSFLGIKQNFRLNVSDDLEYLQNSDFFRSHRNKLYSIEDYEHLFRSEEKLKPIKLHGSVKSILSFESIEKIQYDDLFQDTIEPNNRDCDASKRDVIENSVEECEIISDCISVNTSSSCSSRTSITSNTGSYDSESSIESINDDEDESITTSEGDDIYANIFNFPVQLIGLEKCKQTLDDLILENKLNDNEWASILMQVIMILITYQKTFNFTHNDLHTNNVMYVPTDKKYLYYKYNNITYKVPTYGKIFKIIDYGRAIFKCNGHLFCSDSFKQGEDASTQYNTEPYFNSNKPRLEPNYSFDLCRLGCSIFDYIVNDIEDLNDMTKFTDAQKLLISWCYDDNNINLLYKSNGADRYPDFKLYKMIARCVHNHTPERQLSNKLFEKLIVKPNENLKDVIDIDIMPSYTQ